MKKLILVSLLSLFLFSNENIDSLIKEAKAGKSEAIFKLAYYFENGINVKKDLIKAKKLYKKAANMGDRDAKLTLTLLELEEKINRNVSLKNSVTLKDREYLFKDLSKGDIKSLIQKAKKDDKDALFTLGILYENGYGVIKQDRKRAIELYKKASKLGNKKATNILKLQKIDIE